MATGTDDCDDNDLAIELCVVQYNWFYSNIQRSTPTRFSYFWVILRLNIQKRGAVIYWLSEWCDASGGSDDDDWPTSAHVNLWGEIVTSRDQARERVRDDDKDCLPTKSNSELDKSYKEAAPSAWIRPCPHLWPRCDINSEGHRKGLTWRLPTDGSCEDERYVSSCYNLIFYWPSSWREHT